MKKAQILETILAELQRIQSVPIAGSRASGAVVEFPRLISAGNGESLIINNEIADLISELSSEVYDERPHLWKSISRNDWGGIVRRALGGLLLKTDLSLPLGESSELLLIGLVDELSPDKWNYSQRTFIFGCSLLDKHVNFAPVLVGSVKIERRDAWLEDAFVNRVISKVTRRRLLARWSGVPPRRRKWSQDSANEDAIFDAVGTAPYVCTVQISGIFGETAKEKAVMAARFVLTGVALLWNRPSKAIADLNLVFDGPPYRQCYAFFQNRPEIFMGSKWLNGLHGLSLFGDKWTDLIEMRTNWWQALAEIIDFWLSPDGNVKRPRLMNQFLQALTWFHEACRETIPMIATTKFVAALDALAVGGKQQGIVRLISARAGLNKDDSIRKNGLPLYKEIEVLYSHGRSRVIHGNSDKVGQDWEDKKKLSESLARLAMVVCLEWAANNPEVDDPRKMMEI